MKLKNWLIRQTGNFQYEESSQAYGIAMIIGLVIMNICILSTKRLNSYTTVNFKGLHIQRHTCKF